MGNQIVSKSAETFLIKDFPQFTFDTMLKDRKLFKTTRCSLQNQGPIVVKIYFHRDGIRPQQLQHHEHFLNFIRGKFNLQPHPNVMPYQCICNHDSGALLVRQYFQKTLTDRLNQMPSTTLVQKLWLSFQLIAGVLQIHSQNLTHGDIKPNNIMLTSSGQLFITDFAPFKPTTISNDSLSEYTLYFTEQTQRCYLAPERLVNNQANIPLNPTISKADKKNKLNQISIPSPQSECKPTMDIFSLGCVLAQIFMEGTALFDLPSLQNYRKGNFNPEKILKPKLSNLSPEIGKTILELIVQMVDLQPSNRGQISQIFTKWNQLLFPPAFGGFMFQLSSSLLTPEFALSDERILLIRYHFDLIWKGCFNQVVPMLHHAGSHVMYQTMRVNGSFDPLSWISIIPANFEKFFKINDDFTTQIQDDLIDQTFKKWENNMMMKLIEAQKLKESDGDSQVQLSQTGSKMILNQKKIHYQPQECALIIIDWITSCLPNALHASTKLSAMEMLTALATQAKISDYIRFQRVLPFILHLFDDQQSKVRAFAVQMSIDIIATYKRDQILVPTDLKIFQSYIWPFYQTLMTSCHSNAQSLLANELVRIVFIRNLPKLVQIGQLFFEMSILSRIELKKKQMLQAYQHQQQASDQSNQSIDLSYISSNADKIYQDDLLNASMKKGNEKINEPISTEIVETFDQVKDELRKLVLNIISDTLSLIQEGSLQGLVQIELIKVLPELGVFLGHEKINNVIIPLILACLNKTNFLRKLACLDIITPLCMFVGAQTLDYFLPCLQIILCDSNELLVYRTLKIYTQLASLRLLSRTDQLQILENTSPFLLHPNMWIRSEMKDFLGVLFRSYNLAQKFCHLRPRLINYTSQQIVLLDKVMTPILTPGQTPSRHNLKFDMYLYKPLRRELFDMSTQVEGGQNYRSRSQIQGKIPMKADDAKAMELLDPILKKISTYSKAIQEREKRQFFQGKFMEELRKCTSNLTQFKVPNKIMAQMNTDNKKKNNKEESKKKRNFDNRIGAKITEQFEDLEQDFEDQDDDDDYDDDEDEDLEQEEDEKSQSILHKNIGFESQFQVHRENSAPIKSKKGNKLNKSSIEKQEMKKKKKKRGSEQALLSMSDFLLDKQNQGLSFESFLQDQKSQSIRRSTILKTNMGLNYTQTQGASRILNKTRGKILRKQMKKKKREMRNLNKMTQIDSDKLFIQQALGISPLADQIITATLSGTNIQQFEQYIDEKERKAENTKEQDLAKLSSQIYNPQLIYNLANNPIWYPGGILVNTLHQHNSSVTTLSVASDQRHFATASSDGAIKIWNTLELVNDNRVMMASTLNVNKKVKKIDFFSNILSFAVACQKGHLAIYNYKQSFPERSAEDPNQQKAFINRDFFADKSEQQRSASTISSASSSSSSSFTLLRKFDYTNQGDMPLCKTFSERSVVGGTTVFCMTQRGIARLIDLRMKNQAAILNFGPQHGLPSSICTDRYENCLYIGTLGGYIQLLDLRFMLRSHAFHWDPNQSKFRTQAQLTSAVPIFSLASFQPDHSQILRLGSSNPNSESATQSGSFCENIPLLFVGRGGPNSHQIVLVNMNTLQTEVFLTAPTFSNSSSGNNNTGYNNMNNNNNTGRVFGGEFNQAPRKQSYNLQVQNNSFDPPPILSRQSSLSHYTNSNLMQKYIRNYISLPFHEVEQLMDEDKNYNISDEWLANSKLRYGALKQSFRSQSGVRSLIVPSFAKTASGSNISMPCLISAGGDNKIRFWDLEKDTVANRSFHISSPTGVQPDYVTNFFGDMYVVQERVKDIQSSITPPTNSKSNTNNNNTSSIMKGNEIFGGLAKGFQTNGFTSVGYFGTSYNPKSSLTKRKERLQNVSHRDCVLDMGIVAGAKGQPYLVSCGRDSLVKIWS